MGARSYTTSTLTRRAETASRTRAWTRGRSRPTSRSRVRLCRARRVPRGRTMHTMHPPPVLVSGSATVPPRLAAARLRGSQSPSGSRRRGRIPHGTTSSASAWADLTTAANTPRKTPVILPCTTMSQMRQRVPSSESLGPVQQPLPRRQACGSMRPSSSRRTARTTSPRARSMSAARRSGMSTSGRPVTFSRSTSARG